MADVQSTTSRLASAAATRIERAPTPEKVVRAARAAAAGGLGVPGVFTPV